MNKHEYEFDEVIIGNTLAGLMYSYFNSAPLISVIDKKPFFFEFFNPDLELSKLQLETENYELNGIGTKKIFGHSKLKTWEHLAFVLSLSGCMPLSNKAATIRIEDNNILKITTKKFRVVRIKFKKLTIFDDEGVEGLHIPEKEFGIFKVIDWLDIKSGMKHQYDFFETESDFVREIYFYPSLRFDGSVDRKDAVAISYLKKYQLETFENSDTYVKFKVLKLMKNAGIRGARNGRDFKNPEKYKYYAVKVESRKREVFKLNRDKHKNKKDIYFDYRTPEEIYFDSQRQKGYNLKLNELIVKK